MFFFVLRIRKALIVINAFLFCFCFSRNTVCSKHVFFIINFVINTFSILPMHLVFYHKDSFVREWRCTDTSSDQTGLRTEYTTGMSRYKICARPLARLHLSFKINCLCFDCHFCSRMTSEN